MVEDKLHNIDSSPKKKDLKQMYNLLTVVSFETSDFLSSRATGEDILKIFFFDSFFNDSDLYPNTIQDTFRVLKKKVNPLKSYPISVLISCEYISF